MKWNQVIVNLILGLGYLLLIATSDTLRSNAVSFIFLIFAVIAILSYFKKDQEDAWIAGSLFVAFGVLRLFYGESDQPIFLLKTSAILAFTMLSLVLLIGPWSRFSTKIQEMYNYRRHLGVSALLLGSVHASIVYAEYFNFSLVNALQSTFVFYGVSALSIMFWLGVTSWDKIQKKVKPIMWKILHALLLLSYLALANLFYTIQKALHEPTLNFHVGVIIAFSLFWVAIAPYSIINKFIKDVFGWKQIHVLIHVAYWSVVLHVFFGVLEVQEMWLKAIFWTIVVFVIGSHAIGWGIKLVNRLPEEEHKTKKIDGKTYELVAKVSEMKENLGKKVLVNGITVALFKYKGKVLAYNNTCPHQKGPLSEGKIVNGYLECPWHKWQYSTKDGCGPPEYPDGVAFYVVKVIDDKIFVHADKSIVSKCLRRK